MGEQGKLLNHIADLTDTGELRSTVTETLSPINAANLKAAHAILESDKVVLTGF